MCILTACILIKHPVLNFICWNAYIYYLNTSKMVSVFSLRDDFLVLALNKLEITCLSLPVPLPFIFGDAFGEVGKVYICKNTWLISLLYYFNSLSALLLIYSRCLWPRPICTLRAYSKLIADNFKEIVNCRIFRTVSLGFGICRFRTNIWHFIKVFPINNIAWFWCSATDEEGLLPETIA